MFGRAPVVNAKKIEIIALASDMEFERVFGTRVAGLTISGKEGSTLFVYGSPLKWFERVRTDVAGTNSNVQHELAHAVLHRYFPTQPRWFAEGMAEFLETAEWLDDDTVRIGETNVNAYTAYRAIRPSRRWPTRSTPRCTSTRRSARTRGSRRRWRSASRRPPGSPPRRRQTPPTSRPSSRPA